MGRSAGVEVEWFEGGGLGINGAAVVVVGSAAECGGRGCSSGAKSAAVVCYGATNIKAHRFREHCQLL